jgi:hypothetical protein
MSTLAWLGIIVQVVPVFFIIKTAVSMARRRSL